MRWSLSLEFTNQKLSCKEEKLRNPTAVLWGSSMTPFMRLSMMLPSLASQAHIVQQHIFNVFEWPFKSSHGSVWFNWPHGKNLLHFKHSLLEHSVCCVLIKPVIWGPCWILYVFQELHFREIYMWTGEVTPRLRIHAAPVEHPVSVPNTLIALTAFKTPVTGHHTPFPDPLRYLPCIHVEHLYT